MYMHVNAVRNGTSTRCLYVLGITNSSVTIILLLLRCSCQQNVSAFPTDDDLFCFERVLPAY